jgi:hypothetical protein
LESLLGRGNSNWDSNWDGSRSVGRSRGSIRDWLTLILDISNIARVGIQNIVSNNLGATIGESNTVFSVGGVSVTVFIVGILSTSSISISLDSISKVICWGSILVDWSRSISGHWGRCISRDWSWSISRWWWGRKWSVRSSSGSDNWDWSRHSNWDRCSSKWEGFDRGWSRCDLRGMGMVAIGQSNSHETSESNESLK